jgi:hypothetical protein
MSDSDREAATKCTRSGAPDAPNHYKKKCKIFEQIAMGFSPLHSLKSKNKSF